MSDYVYGFHAVEVLLTERPETVAKIFLQKGIRGDRIDTIVAMAKKKQYEIDIVDKQKLSELSPNTNHQGILAYCIESKRYDEGDIATILESCTEPFILILDGIQDPHNLGACLRTANATGVQMVIAPKDKAVGLTATVSKVACGAAQVTPFISVTNLARTIKQLKERGIWVYGLADQAISSLYDSKLTGPIALVLGNEAKGIRRLTADLCDGTISIPMKGTVSSLNVSVATGVVLFEVLRQRNIPLANEDGAFLRK